MERARPAVTPDDRKRFGELLKVLPQECPEGWTSPSTGPTRLNDYNKAGVFVRVYTNSYLKLVFMITASNAIQVSMSHLNGIAPLPEHIELVKRDFFPKKNAQATSPISGLVYFSFPS